MTFVEIVHGLAVIPIVGAAIALVSELRTLRTVVERVDAGQVRIENKVDAVIKESAELRGEVRGAKVVPIRPKWGSTPDGGAE